MMYSEIMAVCSQIHTKHTNILCGQNVEFFNVKLLVHIVDTGFYSVKEDVSAPCVKRYYIPKFITLDIPPLLVSHCVIISINNSPAAIQGRLCPAAAAQAQ